jgi:hypothetical protein
MKFQIFVIFHQRIFPECYEKLPKDQLEYLTFVAVNPDTPKTYPTGVKIIREWELPTYDARYQKEGYCENSFLFHLVQNGLHRQYNYVGFCQYDMIISDLSDVIAYLETHPSGTCLTHPAPDAKSNYEYCFYWRHGSELTTLRAIESAFENYFGRKLNRNRRYPMLNTYILPSEKFESIVQWALHVDSVIYPWCVEPPNFTVRGHIAGIFERVFALAVGELLDPAPCRFNILHKRESKV